MESFGNNGTKDLLQTDLTESVFDSSTLDKGLGDSSLLGLGQMRNTPTGAYPLPSQLEYLKQWDNSNAIPLDLNSLLPLNSLNSASNLLLSSPTDQSTSANTTTNVDSLIGVSSNTPILSTNSSSDPLIQTSADATAITPSSNLTAAATTSPLPRFAIRTEGTITIGGGDFDGVPADPNDDARIHAHKGFAINGNPTLPVQRDANGNPSRDASGKLILVDKAVVVSPGYTVSNGPSNTYGNLLPPQTIEPQAVNVPAYADVRQQELTRRIPPNTPTTTFNAQQNPMNNAAEWSQKFPAPGTASQPKVVRVTNGRLNVPDSTNLSNLVIIVESGDIIFGGNHNLNNVTLVTNNGNINLASAQSRDVSVLASASVNMNPSARFAGNSLIANGSSVGRINFPGATTTTNPADNVTVISAGSMSYNAASATRGTFLSAHDFDYNSNSALIGSIGAKGNISINTATIVAAFPDSTPPAISATLANDTAAGGTTNTDKITSDATIRGTVTDASAITAFKAGLNSTPVGNYVNILPQLRADGSFTLSRTLLEQINGGALADGPYILHLQAQDASGNVSSVVDVSFTFDTKEAAPTSVRLAANSDSGASNSDAITKVNTPTITGSATAGARVQLESNGSLVGQTIAAANGTWQLVTSSLADGTRTITAKATDVAGNVSAASTPLNLTIDTTAPTVPSGLKLSEATDTGASNSDGITKNPAPILEGLADAGSNVRVYKDGVLVGSVAATENGSWQLGVNSLADGNYAFTATAEDKAGNVSNLSQSLAVTIDTTAPQAPNNLDLLAASDSGKSDRDNITNNPTPKITGVAAAGAVVQLESNGQLVGQTAVNTDGTWSLTTNALTDSSYDLKAKAIDVAGNVSSASTPLTLTVDTTAPSLNLTTPTNNATLTRGARLAGTVGETGTAIAELSYQWDNQATVSITANASGEFDSSLDLTNITAGSHTLTISTQDEAGNIATSSLPVTVNADSGNPTPPAISAALANDTAAGGTTNTDKITSDPEISGTLTDNSSVTVFRAGLNATPLAEFIDVLSSLKADGTFTINRSQINQMAGGTLTDGAHVLHLMAVDADGNVSSFDVSFTLDATAPTLELLTPIAAGSHSDTMRLIGKLADTGAGANTISYVLDGQSPVSLTAEPGGKFDSALASTPLAAGAHSAVVTAFDTAGNSTKSAVEFQVNPADFVLGPNESIGWGAKTADQVILGEQNNFLTQTSLPITLNQATGTRKLRFDLSAEFDNSDTTTTTQDRFAVYLVDPENPTQTLLGHGEAGTALFSLSSLGAEFTPGLVRYDGQTVEVDLTSLTANANGLLVFQLIDGDGDTGSRVQVKNITNQVDPDSVASPIFPIKSNTVEAGAALNLTDLTPTNTLQASFSNVRFDSTTGRYTADLQVQNKGDAVGRHLAVVFPNLPQLVQLQNPSGTDNAGNPYLNLTQSIPPGGLAAGATSDPVSVVFDNPNLSQFDLVATVLTAGANRAPNFNAVGQLSVIPGQRLELPLIATDADGDQVTFTVKSDQPLPTGSLEGNGKLVFAPAPEEIGTYNFTLVATDGANETTQNVQLTVAADPITTTRISGVIQNTDRAPLAGITIELEGVQTVTGANGSFLLEFAGDLPGDTLKVHAERLNGEVVYPFIAEKLPLMLGHDPYSGFNNVISRPIYLPPLDVASGQTIDPNSDVIVTTANIPGAAVKVAAGSLDDQQGNEFTGKLSITEVPTHLTPAALPENLHPDLVVTIQPGEMVFTTPAPLTLPNRAGYAPGIEMDLWSINPNTGLFDKVGTGRVSDDGSVVETIEGGIRNSSWHFFAPPPNNPDDDPRNPDDKCDECKDTAPINSEVELHSGAVTETHDLVPYQSLGVTRSLQLRYDSLRADPRPIVHFGFNGYRAPGPDNYRVVAKLAVSRGNFCDFTYKMSIFRNIS